MTEDTRALVLKGFAVGLCEHAAKLFTVYVNAQNQDGYERCMRGISNAIAAYETLVRALDQDGDA